MSEDDQAAADETVEEGPRLWESLADDHKKHIAGIQEIYQQLLCDRRAEVPPATCGNAVDEVLDELHTLRRAIDAYFDHDPKKYFDHLRDLEQQLLRAGLGRGAAHAG